MPTRTIKKIIPFKFKPFSIKQKMVLCWWTKGSAFEDYDGIIADGSIRSGKSMSMSLSYVMWANVLYCYATFGSSPDWIAPESSAQYVRTYDLITIVSNVSSVTVQTSPSTLVTHDEFEALSRTCPVCSRTRSRKSCGIPGWKS